ncbi:MAG: hypothetical protein LBV46_02540 [Bacteroidales bacterium]|jgi:ribosomal protein S18|nr:hypothetical protein [Bacteroidales bacterium]
MSEVSKKNRIFAKKNVVFINSKKMNKLKLLFLLSVSVFFSTSCIVDPPEVQGLYRYDIFNITCNFENFAIVEDYLTEKGCIVPEKIFTDESEAGLDRQAIALFEENKAKINITELSSRITEGSVVFTYGLAKGSTESGEIPLLKEMEYRIVKE